MKNNLIKPELIISNRFPFKNALDAYDALLNDKSKLGIVLEYNKSKKIILINQPLF